MTTGPFFSRPSRRTGPLRKISPNKGKAAGEAASAEETPGTAPKPRGRRQPGLVDVTGQRFGRLTVLDRAPNGPNGGARWHCRCDCGRETVTYGTALRGGVTSCGRHRRPYDKPRNLVHGHTWAGGRSPTYVSWEKMLYRCENPASPRFARYGGRGIRVCDRWHSFAAFLADMGERPEDTTLDRIDRDGDYEPGNVRWADKFEQARDARRQRYASPEKRRAAALQLRGQGWRLDEIAHVVGVTSRTVRTWLAEAS